MAHNGPPRRFQGFFPPHPPGCAGIWARTLQTRGVQAPVRQPSTVVNSRGDQFVTGKLELEESLRFGAKVRRFVDIAGRPTARSHHRPLPPRRLALAALLAGPPPSTVLRVPCRPIGHGERLVHHARRQIKS